MPRRVAGQRSNSRLRDRERLEAGPLSSRWLIAFIVVMALFGCVVAFLSVSTFREPDLGQEQSSIRVGLLGGTDEPVGVHLQTGPGYFHYTLLFTKGQVGKPWVMVLKGAAMLRHGFDDSLGLELREGRCRPDFDLSDRISIPTEQCQVVRGTVPEPLGISADGTSFNAYPYLSDSVCSSELGPAGQVDAYSSQRVSDPGRDFATNGLAYKIATLPRVVPSTGEIREVFDDGAALRLREYAGPATATCATMQVPDGYVLSASSPEPTYAAADVVGWSGTGSTESTAAFRHSYTATIANAGIVAAGLCFTVAVGLLPTAILRLQIQRARRRGVNN